MSDPAAPIALSTHLALLSSISFGGIPAVLPDLRNYVVIAHPWITDREFAEYFALAQAVPGPNMIVMMGLIGWKVWGIAGAIVSALAIFGPACMIYYVAYRLWDRFREASWLAALRRGLIPVTVGLVVAGGWAVARSADTSWLAVAVTAAAGVVMLTTRINPLWPICLAAALGGLGVL